MTSNNDNAREHLIVEELPDGREVAVRAPLPVNDAEREWAAAWEAEILEPARRIGEQLRELVARGRRAA